VVCHVIEDLDVAGAEMLVWQLAVRMRNGPFAPMVCSFRDGPIAARLAADGIPLDQLRLRRRRIAEGPAFASFALQTVRGIGRVLDRRAVAIVHAHMPDAIIPSMIAASLRGIPIVATYHSLRLLAPGRSQADPRNAIRRALYRFAGRMCDRSIAVSPSVHDYLRQLGLPSDRTTTLLNGIDVEAFAGNNDAARVRNELRLNGCRVVTCVARFAPSKGQRILIDAMSQVARSDADVVLVLVGDGPERPALLERSAAAGIADRVRFAGVRDDIPSVLAASDVFVFPSQSFSEGLPLSLLEAMAARVPVVATDVAGNREVLAGADCGLTVPAGDREALAGAILTLLRDPGRGRALAERAYQRVREHFDLRQSVAASEALYAEVIASRRAVK
jgi:glycosyltransferase involved in cell wall biosynthesis